MKGRVAIFLAITLFASRADAGQIRNYIETKGGCANGGSAAVAIDLMQNTFFPQGGPFLGKTAIEWTDEDIEDFKEIYAQSLRLRPIDILGSLSASGPNTVPPGAIKAKVERVTSNLIAEFIEPARLAQRQRALAEQARIENEKAQAEAQRMATLEQAEHDRQVAAEAQKEMAVEAPLVETAAQEAEKASQLRSAAEKRLREVRQELSRLEQQRKDEVAAAAIAQSKQVHIEVRDRERREEAALSTSCAVTAAQFAKIQLGMRLHEVRQAFGCLGSLASSTRIDGLETVVDYNWNGATSGFAFTTFQNGHLISKTQISLE
jgi:flagellar biosynthesis GTPase FlhF